MSAEAQIAVGNVRESRDLNLSAAGPFFKRAIELNPGMADAHREYGLYFMRMGQFEVAEHYLRKSLRLDPVFDNTHVNLGWNELYRGNYRRARDHLERALVLWPDLSLANLSLAEVNLAQGRVEMALRKARRALETNSCALCHAVLGRSFALAGRPDSARMQIERIREEFGPSPRAEAIVHTALGETDRALDLLEQEHYNQLKVSPWWEPLRGEPRYQRLLERMGLDDASVRRTMESLGEEPS